MIASLRIAALAALLVALSIAPARSQNTQQCEQEYNQAETAYFDAEFDRAIRLLRTCLDEAELAPNERVRFYRLLSFAYIAQDEREQARAVVEQLLATVPNYTPDPETDRPDYVELVREVKAARTSAEEGDRRWLRWVLGGAAVVAGVLAAVLIGSGSGGDGNGDPNGDDDNDFFPRPSLPIN